VYFDSSFKTVIKEPSLYKRLIFHIPNPMSMFLSLGCLSKEPVQVWGPSECFVTSKIFTVRGCYPNAQLQAGGPPQVDCLWLFIQCILSWRTLPPSATWRHVTLWWQRLT
jgi:hypothetical protein